MELIHAVFQASVWARLSGAAGFALLLHYGLFVRGEWHLQSPKIFIAHVLAFLSYVTFLVKIQDWALLASLREATVISVGYVTTMLMSITIYRVFFHRLSRAGFPGPQLAPVSKLWHVWACRDSRNFRVMDELTRKYGDFVRTGPSEITVVHPEVFQVIDGPGSVCGKAEWYDITMPNISLVTARDKQIHDIRRRRWDQGFSTKAINQYTARTLEYVKLLENNIAADVSAGKSIDVTNSFGLLGFDVMGDFIFARSFDMLERREWHWAVLKLQEALRLLGPLSPVPWLVHFAFHLVSFHPLIKSWFAMNHWCLRQMKDRAKVDEEKTAMEPDVSHWLIDDARKNGFTKGDWRWLSGDAILAIVAGSDTVTSTLIGMFYRLACDPTQAEKLYAEVAAVNCYDDKVLQKLPYLNGVCQEALRLHPAVLTGGYRKTPKDGVFIGDTFVPGETTIIAPRYTVFRREDCFVDGDSFIPERWDEKPELVKNKRGFAPFGTGRYACIGKQLGLAEMRLVAATLLQKYRISLTSERQRNTFLEETRDCFTAKVGKLDLNFTPRLPTGQI